MVGTTFARESYMIEQQGTSAFIEYYNDTKLKEQIGSAIKRFPIQDQIKNLRSLVNFSRSTVEPYQSWFRYREGYSRLLVRKLIQEQNLDAKKYFIADPMVGSGTTVVEGCESGFDVLSSDVNPLSSVMVELKTLRPNHVLIDAICRVASELNFKSSVKIPDLGYVFEDYFSNGVLENLLALRQQISKIENLSIKKVFDAAWIMVLEDCSNRKRDGNGLVTRPSKVSDIEVAFLDKLNQITADYLHYPIHSKSKVNHITDSAKNIVKHAKAYEKETNKKLGLVIFSPPYANSFDYIESYKLELVLGEFCRYEELDNIRNPAVRNYRISQRAEKKSKYPYVESLVTEIESAIPEKEKLTGKRDGRSRLVPGMLRSYFEDMSDVLKSIFESLSFGGKCLIVVDQSAYLGKVIPTDYLLALIGEEIGFEVNKITLCRKAMTSAQQLKSHPYLKEALQESVVELVKPASA